MLEISPLDSLLRHLEPMERRAAELLIQSQRESEVDSPNLLKAIQDMVLVTVYRRVRDAGREGKRRNTHWYCVVRAALAANIIPETAYKRLRQMGVRNREVTNNRVP